MNVAPQGSNPTTLAVSQLLTKAIFEPLKQLQRSKKFSETKFVFRDAKNIVILSGLRNDTVNK